MEKTKKRKSKTELKEYFNTKKPGAYRGLYVAKKYFKNTEQLKNHPVYFRYRPIKRNFKRRTTIALEPFYQFAMDLADMRKLSNENDGVNYLFVIIDCFSRFLYVKTLKNKFASSVLNAFKLLKRFPRKLQSDQGTEFKNQLFKEFCEQKNIQQFFTYNQEIKAAFAERIIRTLKTIIWKFCMKNKTKRYIDNLQEIVDSYNNTFHSAIKMTPNEAEKIYPITAKLNILNKIQFRKSNKAKFRIGDYVIITKMKSKFDKSYEFENNWSAEVFKIAKINLSFYPIMYVLKDANDVLIEGKFYAEELQKLNLDKLKESFLENAEILDYNKRRNELLFSYSVPDNIKILEWVPIKNIMQLN